MNIAIIPARSGSKRIKGKNTKEFIGRPIVEYSFDVAKELKIDTIVSSNSIHIKELCVKNSMWYMQRSENNSDDKATIFQVLREVILYCRSQLETNYEYILCLYPCAPLLRSEDVIKAYEEIEKYYIDGKWDCVLPITKDKKECGNFFWISTKSLFETDDFSVPTNTIYYIMPEEIVQDINTEEDWKIAEEKYKKLKGII